MLLMSPFSYLRARAPETKWQLGGWLAFALLLLFVWRGNIWQDVPSYGDVLEMIWGIEWYHQAFTAGVSPLFYPLIFHPGGFPTATLAHTPFLFLLAQPFRALGGAVFAYNVLAILSLVVSFEGSRRFFRLYADPLPALVAALIYTFMNNRLLRLEGHLNILWLTALLPWLGWQIELWRRCAQPTIWRPVAIGLTWALLINFSLYGIFMGPLLFLLLGTSLFKFKRPFWYQLPVAGVVALVGGLPTIWPYYEGARAFNFTLLNMYQLAELSTSVNSLFLPSWRHPITAVRDFLPNLYHGPYDESALIQFGWVTVLLGLAGIFLLWRHRKRGLEGMHHGRVLLLLIAFSLTLGLLLRWDGDFVEFPPLASLNGSIWRTSRMLKPDLFPTDEPEPPFTNGIPLPSYALLPFVPNWEGARATNRFGFIALLMLLSLGATALSHLPRAPQYALIGLWTVGMWPAPIPALPLDLTTQHPAYMWLAEQELPPGTAIAELDAAGGAFDISILYATLQHQLPTTAGSGAFWPYHAALLYKDLKPPFTTAVTTTTLRQAGVRYVLMHNRDDPETAVWQQMIKASDIYTPIACFPPPVNGQIWPYDICIAELAYN